MLEAVEIIGQSAMPDSADARRSQLAFFLPRLRASRRAHAGDLCSKMLELALWLEKANRPLSCTQMSLVEENAVSQLSIRIPSQTAKLSI